MVSQLRRLREASVIGVFLVAAFGLGIVIISRAPGYAGSLTDFLFGSLTGVPVRDLVIVAAVVIVVLFSAGPAIWHMIERRRKRSQQTPQQQAADDAQVRDVATVETPDELGGVDPEKR